ncbi:ABC transporter permease [Deinococcus yavapaiensis]|uniref:Nucleoside ABC transporter membrane protein n=1 Tax=Deinococcus yavapaiensis KR-236 TaxID=694435 RepID=A0A318SMP8_9DEIO|nr:ABC transporter permease [Deinococcus yavapaiensis]PYE55953.1 nucleoside ABC transporter membrane protein [Deinococcus yavapaiensis KR-236]
MTSFSERPSRFAAYLTLTLAVLAAVAMFAAPYATYGRNFNGSGTLLLFPGRALDIAGLGTQNLPSVGGAVALGWGVLAALVLTIVAALTRARWMWIAGLLTLLFAIGSAWLFEASLSTAINTLLAQGFPRQRIQYVSGGMNVGWFLPLAAGATGLLAGVSAFPTWYHRLNRLRGVLVPFVALALAILVGALVVLIIQPVPTLSPLTSAVNWYGKFDLVWFVYTTLFAPLTNIGGLFQVLTLATPLIFAGLSVAFAFRAGLFNIGGSGQILMGAIFATAVGVYLPFPAWLLLPVAVIAAAIGGALWGAIPGFLKARFGVSEVINTIMLNYIASAIFIFLIGQNSFPFFGRTYNLPFRAEGFEARSQELQVGARLPQIPELLGFKINEPAFLPLSPLVALVVFALMYFLVLARRKQRFALSLLASLAALVVLWPFVGARFVATGDIAGSNLNISFFIALASAVFFSVYMWRTSGGYALRAVGFAPKAAEYGGINVARSTLLAMTIAGAFAGLCGTHYVLGGALDEYRLRQNIPANVGFDGITVALVGQSTPAGVVAASVLFGTFDTGGLTVSQRLQNIDRNIVTVLKALIVLFIAAGGFLSRRITNPPPALATPNVTLSSAENREVSGAKPVNTSGNFGEGPGARPAANPENDGRDA